MIISASRRTDIPAFFSPWFFNRLLTGQVLVRNPWNPLQIRQVSLLPEAVAAIVFWTRNPAPMLEHLNQLSNYTYYFQVTINGYGPELEPEVPQMTTAIAAFKALSDQIGPERVIWRYDPIVLSPDLSEAVHTRRFGEVAAALSGFTHRCIISFVDLYQKTKRNLHEFSLVIPDREQKIRLATALVQIAASHQIAVHVCAEDLYSSVPGLLPGACIDAALLGTLSGHPLRVKRDPNQRAQCRCAVSVDIGAYNTCSHGCRYCYANYNAGRVQQNRMRHQPDSLFLIS